MTTIIEEDLVTIQNVLSGNQAAQKLLYEKYSRIVRHFIKGKYPNNCDVDDDVSEIMIKIFLNLNSFDITKKFKPWVYSIANHYMIDKWRCNTISLTSNTTSISYTSSIDSENFIINNSVGTLMQSNNCFTTSSSTAFDNCNSVNFISTQLNPQDFTFLNMKYNYGYDYNEIGREFNISSSTVSNRVNYIKTKLKKDFPEFQFNE
jgi:RNA polymerase sigma-70 factor (ECF subfamily)